MSPRADKNDGNDSDTSSVSFLTKPSKRDRHHAHALTPVHEDASPNTHAKSNMLLVTTIIMSVLAGVLGLLIFMMKANDARKKKLQELESVVVVDPGQPAAVRASQPQQFQVQPQQQPQQQPSSVARSFAPIQPQPATAARQSGPLVSLVETGRYFDKYKVIDSESMRQKHTKFAAGLSQDVLNRVAAVFYYVNASEMKSVQGICEPMGINVMYVDALKYGTVPSAEFLPLLFYATATNERKYDTGDKIMQTLHELRERADSPSQQQQQHQPEPLQQQQHGQQYHQPQQRLHQTQPPTQQQQQQQLYQFKPDNALNNAGGGVGAGDVSSSCMDKIYQIRAAAAAASSQPVQAHEFGIVEPDTDQFRSPQSAPASRDRINQVRAALGTGGAARSLDDDTLDFSGF